MQELKKLIEQKRLSQSLIIATNNPAKTLEDLEVFVQNKILNSTAQLEHHPDFYLVRRQDTARDITIEQTRNLQRFLNQTAVVGNNKVAIIYEADLMNLNAANSILKILEEVPKNSYIFLVTATPAKLLSTILSRCVIYRHETGLMTECNAEISYEEFLDLIINQNLELKLHILKNIKNKDNLLWQALCKHALYFTAKIAKKHNAVDIELNEQETTYLIQTNHIMNKFTDLSVLMSETTKYDLDMNASFIIMLDILAL